MNRILEIAAMALGGLSLFAVCFLGFATMAGVPLHDVAGIGRLFPEPPEAPTEPAEVAEAALEPVRFTNDRQVYESSLGVLGAWNLAAPFTGDELKSLADELKLKGVQLDSRIRALDGREEELDAREDALADQFQALDELRARLEAFEAELALRAEEVERDEAAVASRDAGKWEKLAALIEKLDAQQAGQRLAAYEPADATKILLAMDEKKVLEILNTFQGDQYTRYAEAWAEAAGTTP